jgi:hypothetical protein
VYRGVATMCSARAVMMNTHATWWNVQTFLSQFSANAELC